MPACSPLDLVNEIYIGIASMKNRQFTLDQLVQKLNENRSKKGENRRVSKDSVNRVLTKLWLPLDVRKTLSGAWEIGTDRSEE